MKLRWLAGLLQKPFGTTVNCHISHRYSGYVSVTSALGELLNLSRSEPPPGTSITFWSTLYQSSCFVNPCCCATQSMKCRWFARLPQKPFGTMKKCQISHGYSGYVLVTSAIGELL